MKSALLASAVLLALAVPASAQTVQWRGGTFITGITPGCTPDWAVGDYFNTRYRHPGIGGSTQVGFSFLQPFNAQNFSVNPPVNATFKSVAFAGIVGGGMSFYPTATTKLRITSQVPTTITAATQSIVFTGQVQGFGGLAACTVTFRSTVGLR